MLNATLGLCRQPLEPGLESSRYIKLRILILYY